METPAYLFDQFAKSRGLSRSMAKYGLMMQGFAEQGRSLKECVSSLRIAKSSAQKIARRLMIDFPDYRPYAALEKKGEARPAPFFRPDLPASDLPLFGDS